MKAPPSRSREGFALMAALWLVVLVGATGYALSVRSRSGRLAVANTLDAAKASAAVDAAVETIHASLAFRLALPARVAGRQGREAPDPWTELQRMGGDTLPLGDERATSRVYDAGSRLQLNKASEDDVRRLLSALPLDAGIADRLAQRILDWRDADDNRRARGAEREDYLLAGARTLPANSDFVSVNDLREVEGVTPELLARLAPLLTIRGSGQINVNSAPRAVIASLPGLLPESIDAIMRAREADRPYRTLDELMQRVSGGARAALADAAPALSSRVTFAAREVVVEAAGWVIGGPLRSHADAVFERSGDAVLVTFRSVAR